MFFKLVSVFRTFLLSLPRCSSSVWSSHPHCVHSSHCFWADWSDLAHLTRHDRGDPGQRRGAGAPAVALRLHHPHQETPLSAWAGDGTSRVSCFFSSLYLNASVLCFLVCFSSHLSLPLLPIPGSGSTTSAWRTSWSGTCVSSLWTLRTEICRRCCWPVISKRSPWLNQEVRLYLLWLYFDLFVYFNLSTP